MLKLKKDASGEELGMGWGTKNKISSVFHTEGEGQRPWGSYYFIMPTKAKIMATAAIPPVLGANQRTLLNPPSQVAGTPRADGGEGSHLNYGNCRDDSTLEY